MSSMESIPKSSNRTGNSNFVEQEVSFELNVTFFIEQLFFSILDTDGHDGIHVDGQGQDAVVFMIESVINKPIVVHGDDDDEQFISNRILPLHEDPRFLRFRSAPVRLNLLNTEVKVTDVQEDSEEPCSPYERLRLRRKWNTLLFDVDDEETRVDERHPLLSLNVALIREWCLLHAIDFHDKDRVVSS